MKFIDLNLQYRKIEASIKTRINNILEHQEFIMGKEVDELERALEEYTGAKNCISCANGTDALLMALMALGIGRGDIVFTSPFTFIATAEVIALMGATPVFVDVLKDSFNIDPEALEASIINLQKDKYPSDYSYKGLVPKAIIAVDIFGLTADYDKLDEISKKYGLHLIEDAAQSFGATYNGRKACTFGDISTTSFFPAKPLGCYGDGGAIFVKNDELCSILKSIRVHGKGEDKYDNIRIGLNGRLDTFQAAILLSKLEIFEDEINKRNKVAKIYTSNLNNIVKTPVVLNNYRSAWAQYSIICENRDILQSNLKNKKIPTAIYYPKPLHKQKAFSYLKYSQGSLPVSEYLSDNILSLPMHPYLTEEEQCEIIGAIKSSI